MSLFIPLVENRTSSDCAVGQWRRLYDEGLLRAIDDGLGRDWNAFVLWEQSVSVGRVLHYFEIACGERDQVQTTGDVIEDSSANFSSSWTSAN